MSAPLVALGQPFEGGSEPQTGYAFHAKHASAQISPGFIDHAVLDSEAELVHANQLRVPVNRVDQGRGDHEF